jgi:hypothetical protein
MLEIRGSNWMADRGFDGAVRDRLNAAVRTVGVLAI